MLAGRAFKESTSFTSKQVALLPTPAQSKASSEAPADYCLSMHTLVDSHCPVLESASHLGLWPVWISAPSFARPLGSQTLWPDLSHVLATPGAVQSLAPHW